MAYRWNVYVLINTRTAKHEFEKRETDHMPSVTYGEMTRENGYSKRNNYSLYRKPLAKNRGTVVLITETGRQTSKKSIFVSHKGKSHTG
jgi:hypothetical protein